MTAPMVPLVQLEDVHKSYQDGDVRTEVLRGVDLELAQGESVAIVGPSGSGKSTLLHVIGALDHYDRGSVVVAGERLADLSGSRLSAYRNRRIGFVFQFQELLPDFTAAENIAVPARIAGWSKEEAMAAAVDWLEKVGLSELGHRYPTQLSGGERQRVGLCRALVNRPDLILADEPTGSLDADHGRQVMDLLMELQREVETSLILVTHDRETASRCGRVLVLREGRLA